MKSVLIIDDDETHLFYIKKLFEKFLPTIKLDCANTFAKGIRYLSKNDYALIILDLILPDKSVLGVLTDINIENKVPILVLSGKNNLDSDEQMSFLLLDAADFVSKDIKPIDLVRLISTKLIEY